jgi:hypothetical protein
LIVCPSCQHQEFGGSLFCSECGERLFASDAQFTGAGVAEKEGETVPMDVQEDATGGQPSAALGEAWLYLHALESGQILPLAGQDQFTLGRISRGQPIVPDIDLSPYGAYAYGVSRLHAVIKRSGTQAIIMDLGAPNGTFVNGERLLTDQECPLSHGDIVSLGKLKFQALFKNQ